MADQGNNRVTFSSPRRGLRSMRLPVAISPTTAYHARAGRISRDFETEPPLGKQVRFYMTADDEAAFLDGIRKTGDVALIPWRSAGPVLTPMESLPDPAAPFAYHVCLWNRDVSPPPVRRDVPDTEDQTVDKLVSEVIEWDRSLLREGVLHSGRIWAEFRCWDRGSDPPVLTTKGPAFSKWYDQLARLLRSRGKRNADGDYLWPGSQAFAASGGVLR